MSGRLWMCSGIILFVTLQSQIAFAQLAADLSILPQVVHNGAIFRDNTGTLREPLALLNEFGLRIVRLRLWHTPSEPWHGIDSTVALARRVAESGDQVLLDIHYADSWADPAEQTKPAAWNGLEFDALVDSVRAYTANLISRFRDAGAAPAWVQIGNEITNGMLWPDGRVVGENTTPEQWNRLAALLSAGIDGVHQALPPPIFPDIILHLDSGGDHETSEYWFAQIAQRNVAFDIMGLSYYPWWQGTPQDLSANMSALVSEFGKPAWIVEAAYPFTLGWNDNTHNIVGEASQLLPEYDATPQDQARFVRDIMEIARSANQGIPVPVFYWEPAWISTTEFGSPVENLAWFDFNGDPMPVITEVLSVREREQAAQESEIISLTISPNPLNDFGTFLISGNPAAPYSLTIYDLLGRRVQSLESRAPGVVSINTAHFPSGYFVAHLVGDHEHATTTFQVLK